jgi:hypothetical protein
VSIRAEFGARSTRLEAATGIATSLDFARLPWYSHHMIKSVRYVNLSHMTRFGWAVEGVAR